MKGSEFRDLRLGGGLNQRELALRLGTTAETISRYENNHSPIPTTVQLATRYLCEPEGAVRNIVPSEVETVRRIRALLEERHG